MNFNIKILLILSFIIMVSGVSATVITETSNTISPNNISLGTIGSYGLIVNQTVNITWAVDGVLKQTNTSVITANFTYQFNQSGDQQITATASNVNGSVSNIWHNYVSFAVPSDYVWTPIQDWAFINISNIKIDVKPPTKLGYDIFADYVSGSVAWIMPSQFNINGTLYLTAAKFDWNTIKYVGLYYSTCNLSITSCVNRSDFSNFSLINGTYSGGDAQAITTSYYNGSWFLNFAYNDAGTYKGYVISGTNLSDLHQVEYYPGHTLAPWPIPVSGQGNYGNTGWQGVGGMIWNSTGVIGYGQQDESGGGLPRRISYEFFNSTNIADRTAGLSWNPTGYGAETGQPVVMIYNSEDTCSNAGQPKCASSGVEHEYHGIGFMQVPNETGYYGSMQILWAATGNGQGLNTALWSVDGLSNFTTGWHRVGNNASYIGVKYLINNGIDGSIDSRTAVGGLTAPTEIYNGSTWIYYYNTGRGLDGGGDFDNISAVISDAHKWALVALNDTTTSGNFTTGTIIKNSSLSWGTFQANDYIPSTGGNITFDIQDTSGATLISNVSIGRDISSIPAGNNNIRLKISIDRPNTSVASPEIYNWYLTNGSASLQINVTSLTINIVNNSYNNGTGSYGIFLNSSQSVTLSANSTNLSNTWNWYVDKVPQGINASSLTVSWSSGTYHYVQVNATDSTGTSNTLIWGINVFPAMASSPSGNIQLLNESPSNDFANALYTNSFTGAVTSPIEIYINLLGLSFYAFLWFIVFAMLWIKQQSINIPMTIGVIFGGIIITFLPAQYQLVSQALIVFGIFAVVYVFFKGRG